VRPDDDIVGLDELLELVAASVYFQQNGLRVWKLIRQVIHLRLDVRSYRTQSANARFVCIRRNTL